MSLTKDLPINCGRWDGRPPSVLIFLLRKHTHSPCIAWPSLFLLRKHTHSTPQAAGLFSALATTTIVHPGREEMLKTNLKNKGLISADRSNKATLLLTIPRSVFKSSAKDFILSGYLKLTCRGCSRLASELEDPPCYDSGRRIKRVYL